MTPPQTRIYNQKQIEDADIVYVASSYEDVDLLSSKGFPATYIFKPDENYAQFFVDKSIFILPNNTEWDKTYLIGIFEKLKNVGTVWTIDILNGMTDGATIRDWFAAGHKSIELTNIILSAMATPPLHTVSGVPSRISGKNLRNKYFAPFEFVVKDMFALGHLLMLGGRPKSGKSWLMLQMAAKVDQRLPFLGRATMPCKILYIALEDGERRINQRMKILKWIPSNNIDFMFQISPLSTGGNGHPGLDQLKKLAPFYDLIIVDTLIATLNGRTNENDNVQMATVLNGQATLAHDTNTAIALVHHTGKTKQDDPFDSFRGASSIRGAYDVGAILIREVGEGEAVLYLESRDFEIEDMTLRQSANSAGWESLGNKSVMKDIKVGKRVLEYITDYGDGFTAREFSDTMGITYQAANKTLKTAVKNGMIEVRPIRPNGKGRAIAT